MPESDVGQVHALVARLSASRDLDLAEALAIWRGRHIETWRNAPEVYRLLGRHLRSVGEPLLAYDVFAEAVRNWPDDLQFRQQLALALADSGAASRANRLAEALREEGHQDEETLGILARTYKDLWASAREESERARYLGLAARTYRAAYATTGGYWSGINAATLALLGGDQEGATSLASEVRARCRAELQRPGLGASDQYWLHATLGEAALVLRDGVEADGRYELAVGLVGDQYKLLASTRRNAMLLLAHDQNESIRERIEARLRMPAVAAFSGHIVDRPDRPIPRFPPAMAEAVRQAIRARLDRYDVKFGYASAAAGSDILFLEAVLDRGGEIFIVLPSPADAFERSSVEFGAEGDWGARFRHLLARAGQVFVASEGQHDVTGPAFAYANTLLSGLAKLRSRQLGAPLVPLGVWDGDLPDGPGGTASAVEAWREAGLDVDVIDLVPLRDGSPPPKSDHTPDATRKPAAGQVWDSPGFSRQVKAMLFADAVGFSQLQEEQVPLFIHHVLGGVGELVRRSPHAPVMSNTWGDGLYLVFDSARDAGSFALDLCDFLDRLSPADHGLPGDLTLRVALHAGPVYGYIDPVTGGQNFAGRHVSQAARMEPISPPGQVYASQTFAALASGQSVEDFECDYVGQIPLAKGYGTFPTYHVRRR